MTRPATFALSDSERSALTAELFARWEAADPGSGKCFCGSDAELVAAVERHRDDDERERG